MRYTVPHFKRSGPKSTRAGCLFCKPHKHQGVKGTWGAQTRQEQCAILDEGEFLLPDETGEPLSQPRKKKVVRSLSIERRNLDPLGGSAGPWTVYRRYGTRAGLEAALKSLRASEKSLAERYGRRVLREFRAHPE